MEELPSGQGALAEAVAVQLTDEVPEAEVVEVRGEYIAGEGLRVTWLGVGAGAGVWVWVWVRVRVRVPARVRVKVRVRLRLMLRLRLRLRVKVSVRGLKVTDDDRIAPERPNDRVVRVRGGHDIEEPGEEG